MKWPKIPSAKGACQCLLIWLGDRKAHRFLMDSTHSCRTFQLGFCIQRAFQWKSFNSHQSKLVSSSLIFFRKLNILIYPIILELGIGPEPFTSPHLFNCKTSLHIQIVFSDILHSLLRCHSQVLCTQEHRSKYRTLIQNQKLDFP